MPGATNTPNSGEGTTTNNNNGGTGTTTNNTTNPNPQAGTGSSSDGQGATGGTTGDPNTSNSNQDFDNPQWDEQTKKYIQNLRRENASYRTKAKGLEDNMTALNQKMDTFQSGIKKALGIEDSKLTPEQQVEALTSHNNQLTEGYAILETALEHGIDKNGLKYFKFLLQERLSELDEGEELGEEDLTKIAQDVKAKFSSTGMNGNSTSVTNGNGNGQGTPNPNKTEEMGLEEFCSLSIVAKSKLYQTKPELYTKLRSQAVAAGRFV